MQEMIQRWYTEAGKYDVLPLASADIERLNVPRPTVSKPRQSFVYYPGGAMVPFAAVPRVFNRPFSITAKVVIPEGGAEGVLLALGNRHGGYSLYIKDGHLHHIHNYAGLERFKVSSPEAVPAGEAVLRYEFEPTGEPDLRKGKGTPGRSQLYINDELVASKDLPVTVPNAFGIIGLSCGYDAADAVNPDDYSAPFSFTGEIGEVVLDVSGDVIVDDEADLKRLMAEQ
jgi:arylsulfatase